MKSWAMEQLQKEFSAAKKCTIKELERISTDFVETLERLKSVREEKKGQQRENGNLEESQ